MSGATSSSHSARAATRHVHITAFGPTTPKDADMSLFCLTAIKDKTDLFLSYLRGDKSAPDEWAVCVMKSGGR